MLLKRVTADQAFDHAPGGVYLKPNGIPIGGNGGDRTYCRVHVSPDCG
jgi:hypothetical protein